MCSSMVSRRYRLSGTPAEAGVRGHFTLSTKHIMNSLSGTPAEAGVRVDYRCYRRNQYPRLSGTPAEAGVRDLGKW